MLRGGSPAWSGRSVGSSIYTIGGSISSSTLYPRGAGLLPSWVDGVTSSTGCISRGINSSPLHAREDEHLSGQVDGVTSSTCSISGAISSSTLHAGGAELLPGQVDGVVMLLGVILLPLLEIGPSTNILQTLLGIPHRYHLLRLMERHW